MGSSCKFSLAKRYKRHLVYITLLVEEEDSKTDISLLCTLIKDKYSWLVFFLRH